MDGTTTTKTDAMNDRLACAIHAAREAGQSTLDYFQHPDLSVENKADGSVVTEADRNAELELRRIIGSAFPHDSILGEEHDDVVGTSEYRWILDPIDGTASFVHGVPLYGTLVAVEHQPTQRSTIGVMFMPALDELVYASEGHGAWHVVSDRDPVAARVSNTSAMSDALLCITALDYFTEAGLDQQCLELMRQFRMTRGWSDCYAHLLVATGRADAVIEPVIQVWDVAPMPVIMHEAGGRYSDWNGDCNAHRPTALATNGHIHDTLLQTLSSIESAPSH